MIANNCINDDFENLNHDDVDEALKFHLTNSITNHPEISTMTPDELSKVMKQSLDQSQYKRKKIVKLWRYGRTIYQYTSFGYTAYTIYQHPIIAKMAFIAAWTVGKATIAATIALF